MADVLGCLKGVHIMPLETSGGGGEEVEGGVPEWVLAGANERNDNIIRQTCLALESTCSCKQQ